MRRLEARARWQRKSIMKSAYELAMERLEKASPSISLTEEQKKEIADVDSVYRAKIAEREVFLKDQIRKAQIAGNSEEARSLEKQLTSEMRRLQEECEAKKKSFERVSPRSNHGVIPRSPPRPRDLAFEARDTERNSCALWGCGRSFAPLRMTVIRKLMARHLFPACCAHRVWANRDPENQACAHA
jgi:hypothetical protein